MIRHIHLYDVSEAQALLAVQKLAYQVEADLISFQGIPALHETLASLQASTETFVGCFKAGCLAGAISYEKMGHTVDICRLVIHPEWFRQGIATTLLANLLQTEAGATRFTVTTGAANTPAIHLYQRFGFQQVSRTEIARGVFLSHLERATAPTAASN